MAQVQELETRTLLAAPHPVDLGTLDGTNGFRLDGVAAFDDAGASVSSAGDVNGDGFEDLLVGAPRADPSGNSSAGSSYVVFGRSGGFAAAVNLSTLDGTNGFRVDGVAAGDRSGDSVSSAGDVNGDGFDDLIVGARLADPNGNGDAGSSYVMFGRSGGFASAINLSTLDGTTGFRLDGVAADDQSGVSVSRAGDVNGDGFEDLLVGAYLADPTVTDSAGSSYVVFGRSGGFASTIDLSALDGSNGFRLDGLVSFDESGGDVSRAGDVNGDGFDDLIVGATDADPDGNSSAGSSYVVFGRSDGFASVINLSTLDGTNGFRLDGVVPFDTSGDSVSSAGDINGDGFDDLIVGAPNADPNGNSAAGSSYVVFGRSGGFASAINLSTLDGTTGFRLDGVNGSDNSGRSVSSAGDVNGDGFDDLIVGAENADPDGNSSAGSSYVMFGRSGGFASVISLSTLDGTNGFRMDGVASFDDTGKSVSSAGDVNGDGFDDVIVGAPEAGPNGNSSAGSSYVVFGGNFTGGAETQVGTSGADTLTANQGGGAVDILIGGLGDDTLISDGGDDVLRGGEGDDILAIPDADFSPRRLVGGTGTDTVRLDGTGITLDLTAIADNRLIDIEEIDLTGGGDNALVVTPMEVLGLSGSSNTLTVRGGNDDRVFLAGDEWTSQGTVNLDGIDFEQFTNGAATLNVQTSLGTTFAVIGLDTLNGTNGFRLDGVAAFDDAGDSVSSAGDVNGDGFEDLLVGAPLADASGISRAGSSYVVFGRSGGFTSAVNLSTLDGTNGFRLDGVAEVDVAGTAVSSAGDVNGDGFDDLIIGADNADPNGNSSAGSSYVVFGRSGGFAPAINLSTLDGANGFRLDGVALGDNSGEAVSAAGDVNGDGFDDLIIGADNADPNGNMSAGSSYVVFGRSGGFASTINLSTLDGTNGFRLDGVAADDGSGDAVSAAGDVNGDGFDDLIVGTYGADPNGNSLAGSSYVVFGRSSGFASAINLCTLNGINGFRLDGVAAGDFSGDAVSSAGDVNGDGFDDLVIGASGAAPNGNSLAGSSYVVFGRSGGFASAINLSTLDGTNGFRVDGMTAGDRSGSSVSSAGDVNGDGFDDLIVGAFGADPDGKSSAGSSYVVFGRSGGFASAINPSTLDGANGFRLDGVALGDRSGIAVSAAGDVNGDGFDDVIVGASEADPNGNSSAGSSYVVFGGNFTGGAETQVGTSGADTLTANQGGGAVDILIGGLGDDTLISDGGDDVLRGGEGDDILAIPDADFSPRRMVGGTGTDTLRLDGAGITLDLTSIADNRLVDIEEIDIGGSGHNSLILDLQEVLNLSSDSNTVHVRRDIGDTVSIGAGWTQGADGLIDGRVVEVFTQGAATLKVEVMGAAFASGNGADDLTVRQNGADIEVFDNNASTLIGAAPIASIPRLAFVAATGEDNRLEIDYDSGGFFDIPGGITFVGAGGGTDELTVTGTGSTQATLTTTSGTIDAGTFTTEVAGSMTPVDFTGVETLSAAKMLTIEIVNSLDIGSQTLVAEATAFVQLGPSTTLGGGTIDAVNGVFLDGARLLQGTGMVDGRIFADGGSRISATGSLTVGDAASFSGYFSDGELYTGTNTVTLLDANEALLGSLTVLGSGGVSGTLTAGNGFLLEEGKNLTGQGTVNGAFHNDGHVEGTGSGIVFEDLVTGIGSAANVTYNGGMSPGHSPAEIDLGGAAHLGDTNALFIELGGLTAGSEFDRLNSTGTVNVDGALDVSFIDGFTPVKGNTFEIIGAGTVNGTFDSTSLPTLPLGLDWNVLYESNAVTLEVLALPTVVTSTALNIPQPNPNRSGVATLDLNFDLPVNVADADSLTLFNHTTGNAVDLSSATLQNNGSQSVAWDLTGLNLADGRYTVEIPVDQVMTTVGGPLQSTQAFEFHKLTGDLNGDGFVSFSDRTTVNANFGAAGDPFQPGDANGDGFVSFSDRTTVNANFGNFVEETDLDFGDALDSATFPTTLDNNGARHVITGNNLYLGALRDAETDGLSSISADGDDTDNQADEDGIVIDGGSLVIGESVDVFVTANVPGSAVLNGWIDFNGDGDWDDAGEHVFTDVALSDGSNTLSITAPSGAVSSPMARFRITETAGYSYFGLAPHGEVEDYVLNVTTPPAAPVTLEAMMSSMLAPVPSEMSRMRQGNSAGLMSLMSMSDRMSLSSVQAADTSPNSIEATQANEELTPAVWTAGPAGSSAEETDEDMVGDISSPVLTSLIAATTKSMASRWLVRIVSMVGFGPR